METAMLAFQVDPTDLDPRVGVSVTGIVGVVCSMLAVLSVMPEHAYFTLSDEIQAI